MIPFVRSVAGAQKVIAAMAEHGLVRGRQDLKLYLMCEIPTNALLAEDSLVLFDGLSIGFNDLTQRTLGVDRDYGLINGFDERDPAVRKLMPMSHRHRPAARNTSASADRRPRIFPRSPSGSYARESVRFRSNRTASCP
jgi:phosphoenolpyruvate synthase/pyruvate phosphate dikinase